LWVAANCSNISISLLETLAALLSATISASNALALQHVLQESILVFFSYFFASDLRHFYKLDIIHKRIKLTW
jgi:hypothetical protein